MRVAWEHDQKHKSANAGLAMNFSTDVIQEVTELNMDIHGVPAGRWIARPTSSCATRSSGVHLAGDTVQRMKVARRLGK